MAMNYIIDTSAYSAFFRGETNFKSYFQTVNSLHMPTVVIGELRAGFAAGTKAEYNEKYLQQFLDQSHINVLNLSVETTAIYGLLYAQLKKTGKAINTNDMWIAALALEHDYLLLTLDSDFKRVPNLRLAEL